MIPLAPPPPPPPVEERRGPDLTGLRLEGPGRAPLWGSGARCSPLPLPAAAGICVPFYLQSHRHRTRPRLRSAVIFPSSSSPTCDDPRGSDPLIWTAQDRRPCVQVSCSAASSPSAPGALPAVAQGTLPSMGPARGHRHSADLAHPGVGRRWPGGRAGSSRPHGSALSVTDRTLNPAERRRSPICDCSTNNFFFFT